MYLRVLEDAKEIKAAQQKFSKILIGKSDKHGKITIGYPGGNEKRTAYWFSRHRFWYAFQKAHTEPVPRYWNSFGIRTNNNEPEWETKHQHNITCEINPPLSGNTWQVSGAFVKDGGGKIYLVHTGRIGGGGKGIGKSAFEENFRGKQWKYVEGSKDKKRVVIISGLEDKNLVSKLGSFVREVKRIKKLSRKRKLPEVDIVSNIDIKRSLSENEISEFPDITGRENQTPKLKKRYYYADEVKREQANKQHRRLVSVFAKLLKTKRVKPKRMGRSDLFGIKNNKLILFEMKSITSNNERKQIRSAIGQLWDYEFLELEKYRKTHKIIKVVVLEKKPSNKIIEWLKYSGMLVYWVDNKNNIAGEEESLNFLKKL